MIPSSPQTTLDDLNTFLDEKPYEIGFYAKNLSTGKTVARYGDRSVCLASIVKIFALTELYRQKHEQGLDPIIATLSMKNKYQQFHTGKMIE